MTEEQNRLLQLLSEIDEACSACGASYSLAEHQLLFASRGMGIRGCEADIVMTRADFEKLARHLEGEDREDRLIEGLETNPYMPGWYYRYVDTSTTMLSLDFAKTRSAHGVGVNVHIVRSTRKSKLALCRRMLDYYEKGMRLSVEQNASLERTPSKKTAFLVLLANATRRVLGPRRFSKVFVRALSSTALTDVSEAGIVRVPRNVRVDVPDGFMGDFDRIIFQGVPLNVSRKRDVYLRCRYGKGWKKGIPAYRKEDYMDISNMAVPYAAYMPRIESIISDSEFWKRRRRYQDTFYGSIDKKRKEQAGRWNVLFFVEDRYKHWKRYAPHKEAIVNCYRRGFVDMVWLYLKPYRDDVERYQKEKRALIIDDQIWDILLNLYRINGLSGRAEALLELGAQSTLQGIGGDLAEHYLSEDKGSDDRFLFTLENVPSALNERKPQWSDAVGAMTASGSGKVCEYLSVEENSVMLIDRISPSSTGGILGLLKGLEKPDFSHIVSINVVVQSLSEAVLIAQRFTTMCDRINFVAYGGVEYQCALASSEYIFTAARLPLHFVKKESQKAVYIPGFDVLWDLAFPSRGILNSTVPSINKCDYLVTPHADLGRYFLSSRCGTHKGSFTWIKAEYPRYDAAFSVDVFPSVVISYSKGLLKKLAPTIEEFQNFVESSTRALGKEPSEVTVRLSGDRVDAWDGELASFPYSVVHADVGMVPLLGEAKIVITDNRQDLLTAAYLGIQVVMICDVQWMQKFESFNYADMISSNYVNANDHQMALSYAKACLAKSEGGCCNVERNDWSAKSSELILHAAMRGTTYTTRQKTGRRFELLCVSCKDAAVFCDTPPAECEKDERPLLLMDYDGAALSFDPMDLADHPTIYYNGISCCSESVNCIAHSIEGYLYKDIFKQGLREYIQREWRKLLGDAYFDRIIAPRECSFFWKAMLGDAPAQKIVLYDNVTEVV